MVKNCRGGRFDPGEGGRRLCRWRLTAGLGSRRGRFPSSWLFRLGITAHVSAIGVWFLSAGEGLPLCAPQSVWQGHALWHALTAVSVGLSVLHVMRNLAGDERQRLQLESPRA